ncbi:endolytic transglycosylase MltG [Schaalia sp. 19OD2882]|nr:endolytic transglycosylase MltG [Schaalia sp. 19OD2882]
MRSRRLEHERREARRRRRWRRVRAFFVLLLVLGLVAGAGWYAMRFVLKDQTSVQEADDFTGPGSGQVSVVVSQGESGADIGQKLVDAGVVKSVAAFTRAWEANKAAQSIRPGTYSLMKQMSASDAIAALLDPARRTDNTVTVNPGETVAQVVERMSQVTEFSKEDLDKALSNPTALGLPAEAKGKVEGWLAPGTYEVEKADTPETIFQEMIAATIQTLDELKVPAAQRETVLTKASILEREVNIDQYLPKVARVIENRLASPQGETLGKLQMDSTVLYGVGKSGGIPTAEDLANDNPYNTYLHAGLPPSPIAQPNRSAIEATLKPADGTWLYFVTVNLDTGETLFATTVAEQAENTKKLETYCAAQSGKC